MLLKLHSFEQPDSKYGETLARKSAYLFIVRATNSTRT